MLLFLNVFTFEIRTRILSADEKYNGNRLFAVGFFPANINTYQCIFLPRIQQSFIIFPLKLSLLRNKALLIPRRIWCQISDPSIDNIGALLFPLLLKIRVYILQ